MMRHLDSALLNKSVAPICDLTTDLSLPVTHKLSSSWLLRPVNYFAIWTHKLSGRSLTHKHSDQDKEIVKPHLCIVLLTLAMGLQTATVRRASGRSIRTTFVTGALSNWAQARTQYLSWLRQQSTERRIGQVVRESMQQASFRRLLLLSGTWGCYLVGAICGSALEQRMALTALVFPLCVLAVLIVIDVFRPFED